MLFAFDLQLYPMCQELERTAETQNMFSHVMVNQNVQISTEKMEANNEEMLEKKKSTVTLKSEKKYNRIENICKMLCQ